MSTHREEIASLTSTIGPSPSNVFLQLQVIVMQVIHGSCFNKHALQFKLFKLNIKDVL